MQSSVAFAVDSTWEMDSFDLELILGLADSDMEYSYDEDWTFAGIHPDGYMSRDSYIRDRETQSLELRLISNDSRGYSTIQHNGFSAFIHSVVMRH